MLSNLRPSSLLFALIAVLCLALIAWWVWFQVRFSGTLELVGELLERGDPEGAARALAGGEDLVLRAQRQRRMFLSEGIALSVAVVVGLALFAAALVRERRVRQAHTRFFAGATHELKTPLATLRLAVETLQSDRVDRARAAEYLQIMASEISRLEDDLQDLLRAASLPSARRRLSLEPGDLREDVAAVVRRLEPRLAATGVNVAIAAGEPAPVRRDPEAISTVVRNLLDNAVKFSSAGDRVTVELLRDGGDVQLVVRDQGCGMGADQGRVFQPFYRGAANNGHTGGTGLGLYLVAELVRAHGGAVAAHSDGPQRGSEFRVRLPLCVEGAA
ncbi:MAG: HAMP domain-containing sensor histidine kinase [Planctomycetota bacterium]